MNNKRTTCEMEEKRVSNHSMLRPYVDSIISIDEPSGHLPSIQSLKLNIHNHIRTHTSRGSEKWRGKERDRYIQSSSFRIDNFWRGTENNVNDLSVAQFVRDFLCCDFLNYFQFIFRSLSRSLSPFSLWANEKDWIEIKMRWNEYSFGMFEALIIVIHKNIIDYRMCMKWRYFVIFKWMSIEKSPHSHTQPNNELR